MPQVGQEDHGADTKQDKGCAKNKGYAEEKTFKATERQSGGSHHSST